MESLSGIWSKIIDLCAGLIISLGFLTAPAPEEVNLDNLRDAKESHIETQTLKTRIEDQSSTQIQEGVMDGETLPLPNIKLSIPEGWYRYEWDRKDHVVLTKVAIKPRNLQTELYALGEQINFYTVKIGKNFPELLEEQKKVINTATTSTSTLHGFQTIRIERNASGTSNSELSYYVLDEGKMYVFSLYPLNQPSSKSIEKDLEEFMDRTLSSLSSLN